MELCENGFLDKMGVKLLGANPTTIAKAEDRQMFKDTMEKIGEPIIASKVVHSVEDAVDFTREIGLPVIIRPAYTLGGTGGGIAYTWEQLREIAPPASCTPAWTRFWSRSASQAGRKSSTR